MKSLLKTFYIVGGTLLAIGVIGSIFNVAQASYEGVKTTEKSVSRLVTSSSTLLGTVDTYYKIVGAFADNGNNFRFTTASDNRATYTGNENSFLFTGASDVKVDKVCELTYALFLNGVLVSGAETPHDFTAASKTENISITSIIDLKRDDYLEVWAKSDTINTTLTVEDLLTTTWGSY